MAEARLVVAGDLSIDSMCHIHISTDGGQFNLVDKFREHFCPGWRLSIGEPDPPPAIFRVLFEPAAEQGIPLEIEGQLELMGREINYESPDLVGRLHSVLLWHYDP
jgi:hypothetical protein